MLPSVVKEMRATDSKVGGTRGAPSQDDYWLGAKNVIRTCASDNDASGLWSEPFPLV